MAPPQWISAAILPNDAHRPPCLPGVSGRAPPTALRLPLSNRCHLFGGCGTLNHEYRMKNVSRMKPLAIACASLLLLAGGAEGKIQIQSESAEVFYRNIAIRKIDRIPDEVLLK